jgi:hypothetical protein
VSGRIGIKEEGGYKVLLNNDRLSHWCVSILFGWTVCFSLFGIPIFHFWLGFSIVKIAVSVGICCGVQLAITPWLFSARATPQNPGGLIGRRTAAVFVWYSLTALLLFYYIQRGWPSNQTAQQVRVIMSVALVVFLIILGAFLLYNIRSITMILLHFRSKRESSQGPDGSHPGK